MEKIGQHFGEQPLQKKTKEAQSTRKCALALATLKEETEENEEAPSSTPKLDFLLRTLVSCSATDWLQLSPSRRDGAHLARTQGLQPQC